MTQGYWIILAGVLLGFGHANAHLAAGEEKGTVATGERDSIGSLFVRRLDADVYEKRAAALLRAAATEPQGDERPIIGRKVAGVFPDGPAFTLGIVPGDVVVRLDDRLINGPGLGLTGNAQQLEYYSHEAKELRTVRVQSPKLGVQLLPYWAPEASLPSDVEAGKNDSRMRHVRVGTLCWRSDPDLAETAWLLAVEAGAEPDAICRQIGAEIAIFRNRPDAALAAVKPLIIESIASEEELPAIIDPGLLYRAALAAGDLESADGLVRRFPKSFDEDQLPYIETLKRIGERYDFESARRKAPSSAAESMLRIDRVPQLRGSDKHGVLEDAPALRRRQEVSIRSATAHYTTVAVQPAEPLPNFSLKLTFSAQLVDDTLDVLNKMVSIRILRMRTPAEQRAQPGPPDRLLLSLGLDQWGMASCESGLIPDRPLSFPDLSLTRLDKGRHVFEVTRVGGAAEVSLNGHRIQLLPIETAASIRFEVIAIGVNAKIHGFALDELLEQVSPMP